MAKASGEAMATHHRRKPLYYATPEHPHPPTFGRVRRAAPMMIAAEQRLKTWESPSNGLIKEIATTLVDKGIGVKLFGWYGVRWYAEVISVIDGLQMPSTICGLILMWEVFSDFGELARRSIILDKQNVDSTSYKPMLRPGVLLKSSTGTGTTSGIPLKGPDGKRWFTVAHHGFKVDNKVHHPRVNGSNTIVGRV
jgi:hypothetical protein